MKTSTIWNCRSIANKIMMGLIFAAMIGNMDVAPALGKDNYYRTGNHDNVRYEQRGQGYVRGRYVYVNGRRVYQPYGHVYRERVYAPPPVMYAPPPPLGISIFFPPLLFPPIIIHP